MKHKLCTLLVVIITGFVTQSHAQPKFYLIDNSFGVTVGGTYYDIITDNFDTKAGIGWMGGLSATVDLPHKWYTLSYGMQVSENNMEISGRMERDVPDNEMIKYKLLMVQAGLTWYIKIIGDNLTIDLGPQIQYSSKLELKNDSKENYYINGYDNIRASEISPISQLNFNGLLGASAGVGAFNLKAQYIYGLTNMLKKLNDRDIDTSGSLTEKFKGNQSMIVVGLMFRF
jgi:hypothetical protein